MQPVTVPKEPETQQCRVQHPLTAEAAQDMHQLWRLLETSYLEGLKTHLCSLSNNHVRMTTHFNSLELDFSTWLRRPTQEKDLLVSSWGLALYLACANPERHISVSFVLVRIIGQGRGSHRVHGRGGCCCRWQSSLQHLTASIVMQGTCQKQGLNLYCDARSLVMLCGTSVIND